VSILIKLFLHPLFHDLLNRSDLVREMSQLSSVPLMKVGVIWRHYITNDSDQIAPCSPFTPLFWVMSEVRSRDSLVGIATRYGLDGPGIESRWGARFSKPVQTGCGAHPAPYTMGTGSFPGVRRPVRCVDHPPPSSAEVKERVELYLCSPSRPS